MNYYFAPNLYKGLALTFLVHFSLIFISGVLQCTQEGYLRLTTLNKETTSTNTYEGSVPMGIRHFKASNSGNYFAYAGKEVNLSVWNTEQAFSSQSSGTKAKDEGKRARSGEQLFKGEIWRAKNVGPSNARHPSIITQLGQPTFCRCPMTLSIFDSQ